MSKTTVVASKKFGGAVVEVRISNSELGVSIALADFITRLAELSVDGIASAIAASAGNPALLMTSAQLAQRLKNTANTEAILQALIAAALVAEADLKAHSVVAQ